MDNKVNFLRGTATEYEASTKDNDTFYYTTDDEKLYLGNKEITGGGVTIDDTLSDTSKNPVQNKVINAALNNKAELTDIPTTLPANGGIADTARQTVSPNAKAKLWEDSEGGNLRLISPDGRHYVEMDIFNNESFRMYFVHESDIIQALTYNFSQKKLDINGNAATVNGLTVQTAVPANAKFTDTTYGNASASAPGLVSTGAQTLAGNKTFNGQVIPAGASAVGTAQARKIYAGTSDMTAGTTKLETGAIYLVYE